MTRYPARQLPPSLPKRRSLTTQRAYRERHPYCQVCGGDDCGNENLELHHIARGADRSDDPENFLMVGPLCHLRCSGATVRHDGKTYEPISFEEQVDIKVRRTIAYLKGVRP